MGNQRPQKDTGRTIDFADGGTELIIMTPTEQVLGCCIFQIPTPGQDRRFAVRYGVAAQATGSIQEVGGSSTTDGHVDGETVTISDGTTNDYGFGPNGSAVFEYDEDGVVVAPNIQIFIKKRWTPEQVAAVLIAAINNNSALPWFVTARANSDDASLIELENDLGGVIGNVAISDTVASVEYIVSGMAGGVDIPDPDIGTPGTPRLMGAGVWVIDYYGNQIKITLISAAIPADVELCELSFSTNIRAQQQRIAFASAL